MTSDFSFLRRFTRFSSTISHAAFRVVLQREAGPSMLCDIVLGNALPATEIATPSPPGFPLSNLVPDILCSTPKSHSYAMSFFVFKHS